MTQLRRLITADIPFARDDAHRLLPAMIGCLVGFAALLLAAALSLNNALDAQTNNVAGILQIEIPSDAPASTPDKVTAQLKRVSGIKDVTVMDHAEMQTLLKPWLGTGFSIDNLPVPTLMEVKTRTDAGATVVDLPALRKSLEAISPDIRVTASGPWVQQLSTALKLLQSLVLLVAALLLACVAAMVVLVARTNLKLHFKTVGLLHMFGATDDYILRQFQWNGAWLAARGAAIGVAVAAVIFAMVTQLSGKMQSPIIPAIHFSTSHVIALLLLPILTALVAFVATRLTVQSMLHHMH